MCSSDYIDDNLYTNRVMSPSDTKGI